MKYIGLLVRSELRAIVPVLVCAALFTVVLTIVDTEVPFPSIYAFAYFLGALLYGGVLALVYGAPLYAWLQLTGRASWPSVIVVGALPGVVLLWVKVSVGLAVMPCGVLVACATHFMARNDALRDNTGTLNHRELPTDQRP
jgi:hypothetical protein